MSKKNGRGVILPHPNLLVPPSSLRVGDPPPRCAELAVLAWGPNKPEAARAILELAEKPASDLVRIEVEPPFRTLLPAAHYDEFGHPLVDELRATGCHFAITCYPWACPVEEDPILGDTHRCSPRCSVTQLAETFWVPPRQESGTLSW